MKKLSLFILVAGLLWTGGTAMTASNSAERLLPDPSFEPAESWQIVQLVNDAVQLIQQKGELAFPEFAAEGSKWRKGDTYVFVLDLTGKMLVHPDKQMLGRDQSQLMDVSGKRIIQGLIAAATAQPDEPFGWYHYQWPVPGGIQPRWKSTFVHLAVTPTGQRYIAGCGVYNDRMERPFVTDLVKKAALRIEQRGRDAFEELRDPAGDFRAKDAYVFVIDPNGVELVNPAFPTLEGRNILDLKDAGGKQLVREMFATLREKGSGWVDYMWPKPGEHIPTMKSTYVSQANFDDQWVLVGCGVYLGDAPVAEGPEDKISASELMQKVRDAADVFQKEGEAAFPKFRQEGGPWFKGDQYFFAWTLDGTRYFHAANPAGEGEQMSGYKDALGRPMGLMFLDVGNSPSGEGWVHYMYPEPGEIYPMWKSTYLKRVTFPSGEQYIIGCGIYQMEMDRPFIEDLVDRAAGLIAMEGEDAFPVLSDRRGAFYFMDTYVFVVSPDGTELLNPAFPSLEGQNMLELKDLGGEYTVKKEIDLAMRDGKGWLDMMWYIPGKNTKGVKHTYVRKVVNQGKVYIVGSGFFNNDQPVK